MLKTVKQLKFTRQEIQIATLIREGKTTKEIAMLLGVAVKTIDTHRNRIPNPLANLRSKRRDELEYIRITRLLRLILQS